PLGGVSVSDEVVRKGCRNDRPAEVVWFCSDRNGTSPSIVRGSIEWTLALWSRLYEKQNSSRKLVKRFLSLWKRARTPKRISSCSIRTPSPPIIRTTSIACLVKQSSSLASLARKYE